MFFLVLILGLVMIFAVAVNVQSQALRGQIEGGSLNSDVVIINNTE